MDRKLSKRAIALMTTLMVATPAGFVAVPAWAYTFTEVRIEGAQRIEPATIMSFANIAYGRDISAGELNAAQQRLQNSGLFETVQVQPQGNTLIIKVKEYPTINAIAFEGNRRIKDEQLAEIATSKSRHVYSPAQAERDAANMAQAYAGQGRMAARVTPRIIPRDGNRVDLVFEVKEGDLTEIERIGFTGNRAFSDRRLRQVLDTKQAGILRQFIRQDVYLADRIPLDEQLLTDFYRSNGYADFKVQGVAPEIARERDAFYITFAIEEGPRYTFGKVDTISEVPGIDLAAFEKQVRVREGAVYNPSVIDTTIRRMETVALQQGLDFVNIEPRITRNMRNQTLDLTFALTRGPRVFVERIDIEGNTTTLDEVIRRQFNTVEGDPFNPREIRNSAERVRALGYFSNAQVETRQGSTEQQVIVDVNVEEQPTGSLQFGVSYGAEAGPGFNAALREQNFLGRGQELGVSFAIGQDNQDSSITFTEPYFLGRNLRASAGIWYDTTDQMNADFDTDSLGARIGLEFPVSQNARLGLTYRISEEKIKNVEPIETRIDEYEDGNDNEWEGSSPIIKAEEGAAWTSALGYTYSWDSRRTGLDPLTAYKFEFGQEFAGLGGDVQSITTRASAGVESRAWRPEVTLSGRLELGAIHMLDGDSRVIDRFNGRGLRGFEPRGIGPRDLNAPNEDALGGNYYFLATAEARFPIGLPEEYGIQGGLFADVGSVWGLDNTQGYNGPCPWFDGGSCPTAGGVVDDGMKVRASVGASLFWDTPIGPLRFNLAKPLVSEDYDEEQVFDMTIQTRF